MVRFLVISKKLISAIAFCVIFTSTAAFAAKPVVSNIMTTVDSGSSMSITLSGIDNDRNEKLTFYYTSPRYGKLQKGAATSTTQAVSYTSTAGFVGSDSFIFVARDRTGNLSNRATVTITVKSVNVAPIAFDQIITTEEDTPVTSTLTATDANGDALTFSIVTQPQNGTVSLMGAVAHYVPNKSFVGQDSFEFTATDGLIFASPATVSVTITETVVSYEPVPFGFWGLNGFISSQGLLAVATDFNATIFQVASSAPHYTATSLLPLVKAAGMKVTLRMTNSNNSLETNGHFDLQKWKDQITAWKTSCNTTPENCIQTFIQDGTLAGHMLIDDIYNFEIPPTAEELDEMARYSQEIFPGLFTFVRNKASTMPEPEAGEYVYLDACVNQYTNYQGYSDGEIEDYVIQQATAADSLGISVINGLNIADGGDGSSGQQGWSTGKYAMSAAEITRYGTALLDRRDFPTLKMFLLWEYDGQEVWSDGVTIGSDYFDQTELQEALYDLGLLAE